MTPAKINGLIVTPIPQKLCKKFKWYGLKLSATKLFKPESTAPPPIPSGIASKIIQMKCGAKDIPIIAEDVKKMLNAVTFPAPSFDTSFEVNKLEMMVPQVVTTDTMPAICKSIPNSAKIDGNAAP